MGCCFNSSGLPKRPEIIKKNPTGGNYFILANIKKKGLFRVAEVGSSQEYSMGSGAFKK